MKTILAAMFAAIIGLTFVGSTFAADEKKMDAPAGAPAGEMKKDESKKRQDLEAAEKDYREAIHYMKKLHDESTEKAIYRLFPW